MLPSPPTVTSSVSSVRSNSGASTTQQNAQAFSSISPPRLPISSRAAPSSSWEDFAGPGGEEHRVAGFGADRCGQPVPLVLGDVLGDRTAEGAVGGDGDVGQTAGAALLRPFLPGVEAAARGAGAALLHDGTDEGRLEDPERGVGEVLGEFGQFGEQPQVGLVRAVPVHRVGVGDPRDRGADLVSDQPPQRDDDLLADGDDVVLVDEGHLDVELGELRLPVGAEILVPVAAGDLVVPLHPGDHQQLLEQLRRLRQRVPGAGLQPGRHQEVAGALGGGPGQRRGLDLDEVLVVEDGAGRPVDRGPQPQRGGRAGSTQVQVAVLEPGFLADGDGVVDLERQRRRFRQHLESVASTSMAPVGRSGLALPSGRIATLPVTRTQNSLRRACEASAASPEWKTTCATPEASRRSMKITPP